MTGVFLSYSSGDRDLVRTVRDLLLRRGVRTFLDRDDLRPGQPWPHALEEALGSCTAVLVFLGESIGSWQKREMWFALDRQAAEEKRGVAFPVIPVLLPRAVVQSGFLFLNTWVDLRGRLEEPAAVDAIVAAVEQRPIAVARPEGADAGICPYRGLDPFEEEHAAFFCGREAFVERLHEKVLATRLVTLVGSSGCGKSSIVRAGLVPRLRRSRPPETTWDVISFTPGNAPYRRLARELVRWLEPDARPTDVALRSDELGQRLESGAVRLDAFVEEGLTASGAERVLLVVDQFEELFTQADPAVRPSFVACLLGQLRNAPVTGVLTMRADFYGLAIDVDRGLSDLMQAGIVNVGRLRKEELQQAIETPAQLVGLSFESPLFVEKLLDDVGDEPGNLPLLEYALLELWRGREHGKLLEKTYKGIRGVTGAIAARAEAELAKLSDSEQIRARRVMTRLVHTSPTRSGLENTRQRASLVDLGDDARAIVNAFSQPGVRLLVTGKDDRGHDTVEVAHEALIGAWARLQQWLAEDVELRLWRQRLEPSLEYWERDSTNVLRGLALSEAEKWLADREQDLVAREIRFIRASVEQRDRETSEAEARRVRELRTQRRWTMVTAAGACVVALLAAFALYGLFASVRAMKTAQSRELASAAVTQLTADPELSLLLAREGRRIADTVEAETAMRQAVAVLRTSHVRVIMRKPHGGGVRGAAFHPDGSIVVTASEDGGVRTWDAKTGRFLAELPRAPGIAYAAAFDPAGGRIVTAHENGTAAIWAVATGSRIALLAGHAKKIRTVEFSEDGARVLTGSEDGTARIWDAATGRALLTVARHDKAIRSASFSRDGGLVVTASDDGTARVWDATSGKARDAILRHRSVVNAAAFSPDARLVVTGSADMTARIWDWASGACVKELRHDERIRSVAFDPDGTRIVTGTVNRVARVWSAAPGKPCDGDSAEAPLLELRGHEGEIHGVRFDAGGGLVVTAAGDGTARIWDADPSPGPIEVRAGDGSVRSVAFERRGDRFVTSNDDGTARVWSLAAPRHPSAVLGSTKEGASAGGELLARVASQQPAAVAPHRGWVNAAVFHPDGRAVLTAGSDGRTLLWDARGGSSPRNVGTHEAVVYDVAFNPDGDRMIAATGDGRARVWDLASGAVIATLEGHRGRVTSASFSSDGERVVTSSQDGIARVWDARSGLETARLVGHEGWVHRAAFDPEGRFVVTAGRDGSARIWDARTGAEIRRLRGHSGAVHDASFCPRGRYVVTASEDRTARIWDANSGERVSELTGHHGTVLGAAFSPDCEWIVTVGGDGAMRVYGRPWICDRSTLDMIAAPLSTRELTNEERRRYLH